MSAVEEFLVIEEDGEYASKKYMTFYSDGWILISDPNSGIVLAFSPPQTESLTSFFLSLQGSE